jgi:hypothetical protein
LTCWRDITISADAGWTESLWLLDGNQPVELTGRRVELYVLPAFDWAGTPIRVLNSLSGGEIAIDNAATGAISIAVTQADVAAHLPVGTWKYFLRVLNGPSDVVEYLRGNLIVLAGRTS